MPTMNAGGRMCPALSPEGLLTEGFRTGLDVGRLSLFSQARANYTARPTHEVAMRNHPVVSQHEWLDARARLLAKEKAFTRQRDQLSEERRALPWVKVDKEYVFDGSAGRETLSQLFQGRSQLLIYHFMYGTDWNEGCKNCSFWADSFNGITAHLKHRDVTMIVVSRAPYSKLKTFQKRMGWSFKWVSSSTTDFSRDFNVAFTPEDKIGRAHV